MFSLLPRMSSTVRYDLPASSMKERRPSRLLHVSGWDRWASVAPVTFWILAHPARWLLAIFEAFDASLIDLEGEDITDLERHERFACPR